MSLKESIENNPVLFVAGLVIAGFLAGVGGYKAVLEIAEGVQKAPSSEATLDEEVEAIGEVLDALEIPAMLYSEDLRLLHANEKMASIYRMRKGDMVGKSPDMLNLIIKPHVENYNDFAAEQLDRIAKGHRGETEGRAQVPMSLSASYLNRKSASNWYFVSNPVYIGKRRLTLTQLLEQMPGCPDPDIPCVP